MENVDFSIYLTADLKLLIPLMKQMILLFCVIQMQWSEAAHCIPSYVQTFESVSMAFWVAMYETDLEHALNFHNLCSDTLVLSPSLYSILTLPKNQVLLLLSIDLNGILPLM